MAKKKYQAKQKSRCDQNASGCKTLKTCGDIEVLEVPALLKNQLDIMVLARPHTLDQ